MNSMQYSNNLCQAIEIIANNVVQGLNYDKTILCTITNIDKAKQGQYTVSDGSSTYIAYSSIKTYKLNTQVYVLIPNGDYNQQKMIVGDYSTSSSEDKGYSLPIDTIIPVEKLEYENSDTTFGLIANENKEKGSAISVLSQTELKLGPQYTRLAIEGDFQTSFKQSVIDGNYGIVVLLSGKDENDNNITDRVYSFNCNNFFGNPYNFTAAVTQSVVFDISDFKKIEVIKVQVQESGDFYDVEKKYLPVNEIANIIIKNLTFTLGFDINEYDNNDLLISSKNELTYDNEGQKDLLLNWVRQRNNKTLFGINSKTDISLNNYNYLRHLWRNSPDSGEDKLYYAGKTSNYISVYWYNYTLENIPTDSLLKEDLWKVSSYYNNQFYSSEELKDAFSDSSLFTFSFNPSIRNFREKVKTVIAISGCLSKKTLKTQEIEVDNKLLEVVLVQEMTEHGQTINKPEYEYIYYSPKDELIIEDIFNEEYSGLDEEQKPIKEKIPAYKQNADGTYISVNEEYQRVVVEWVQYYQKEDLSINNKGEIQFENNNKNKPIYSTSEFIYLTVDEFSNLNSQYYNNNDGKWYQNIDAEEGKIYKGYKLTLTPLVLFKSNEISFENTDEGSYKRLNLINNMELKCLDEFEGRYFIYGLDNTISMNMANNGGRRIQVNFNSINSEDVKSDNVKIQWKIPVNNTMISEPTEEKLSTDIYDKDFLIWNLDDEKNPSYWISNEITIKNTASGSKDTTDFLTMSIPYGIKDYYSPSLTNNTIICLIKKVVNGAEASDITVNQIEFELLFGPSGTNGTDYTLKMSLGKVYNSNYEETSSEKQSFIKRNSPNDYIKIDWNLYDGKNLVQNATGLKCSWWVTPEWTNGKSTIQLEFEENSNNYFIHSCYNSSNNNFNLTKHCAILKGTLTYNGIELEAYLPIPMRYDTSENKIAGYEGVDKIIYDGNGTNPIYYKNEHKFYDSSQKEITYNSPLKWYIYVNREKRTSRKDKNYFPTFMDGESNTNKLKPSNIYYSNNEKAISIIASKSSISDETPAEDIIFAQPVLIIQNRFGNSMLNKWDGNLLIDEDNNSILAAQIAAGSKDNNNKFSGVLMGAVGQDGTSAKHGLYGYSSGALSFGFKEDGTAFIGKSGSGRINFNGTESTITSSAWTTANKQGMHLDLDDGIAQFKNSGGFIKIDPTKTDELFVIKDKDSKILINIGTGTNKYYLQSASWSSSLGMHLNLNNGQAQFRNSGGYVSINPNDSVRLFRVDDEHGNRLMNIGTGYYYLQSSDYISGIRGFRLNLQSHNFSLQQFLPKKDLTNAGITLSNSSDGYFKIVKNRARLAKNVEFKAPGETEAKKYHMYIDPWGQNVYLRDCSTGSFYSVGKTKNFCLLNIGIERTTKTFTLTSDDKTTQWTGYRFRILGTTGLQNVVNNMTNKTLLDVTSNSSAWSYNISSDRLEHKGSVSGGKTYTNLYYPLEYATATIRTDQFERALSGTGHTNSMAYQPGSNRFFSVRSKSSQKNTIAGYLCDFTNGNTSSTGKSYTLTVDNNDGGVGFWEIAIPKDNDKILYGLTDQLYKYTMSDYNSNFVYEETIAALSSFKNSNYTYQGMAADDKYIYLPRFKTGNLNTQDIQIISAKDGSKQTTISFSSLDRDYEIEELDFLDGYMYVSFSRVAGYATGYVNKIYKFKYSNTNIPSTLDLIEDVIDSWIVINNYNTTHYSGQGFCVGQVTYLSDDKEKTSNCFINGFWNGDNEANGLALINIMGSSNFQEEEAVNLFFVSKNSYYLQSENYRYSGIVGSVGNTGLHLNLETGRLNAFSFNMQLGKSDGSYIKIDSGASSSPIQVYGPPVTSGNRKKCVIGWNGILTAEGANITGTITATSGSFEDCTIKNGCTIGEWSVGSKCLYYGDAAFGTSKAFLYPTGKSLTQFNVAKNWVLGIGSSFGVTSSGELYASAGKIGNCIIDSSGKLVVPAANITGTLDASHINATNLKVDAANITGTLDANVVTIENLTVSNASITSLSVGKLTSGTCNAAAKFTNINVSDGGNIGVWHITKDGALYSDYSFSTTIVNVPITVYARAWIHSPGLASDDDSGKGLWVYSVQHRIGDSGNYTGAFYVTSDGGCYATTFENSSDKRLKTSFKNIEDYEKIFYDLKPTTFLFKHQAINNSRYCGFLAQDVVQTLQNHNINEKIFYSYENVNNDLFYSTGEDNGKKYSLQYNSFIALNTHMIQKCLKRIDELENEIKTLKAQL